MIENRKNKIRAVLVVAACFMMVFVCLGFCSSNKSLYLGAITQALGIQRSLFSINDSFRYVTTAVVNLFFGALIGKFGVKKLVGAGFLCLIASTLIYATASHVAVFYIGGIFLGMGLSFTTTTMVSYLIGRWNFKNRGTVTGLALCGNGLGGALAAQIITPIIYQEGNAFGYRNAYVLVAVLLAVAGITAVSLIREPEREPDAASAKKKPRGRAWVGMSFGEALRKPYFYGAAVCVFITGMSLQGINGIAGTHLTDVGLDKGVVATVMSAHSVVLCFSKFLAGVGYDKLGLRKILAICEFCGVLSFAALAMAGNGIGYGFAWGVLSALALPLETVIVPLIAADLFGEKDYPRIMGIFVSINTAGFALGTPSVNLFFDLFGTYVPVLYVIAGAMLCMIIGFGFIISASNRDKQRIVAETSGS